MLELKVQEIKLPKIVVNFEEMEKYVLEKRKEYAGLIVTEDNLKSVKKDRLELASARKAFDDFRKEKKKEMSVPIVAMETQCKKLIGLIEEVEAPLEKSIKKFDDEAREKRRKKALECIAKEAGELALRPEYASRLQVKDFYLNLSGTQKEVKEDVHKDALALKSEQDAYDMDLASIKGAVSSVNESLLVKLNEEEFCQMLTSMPAKKVIQKINSRAQELKLAEEAAKEQAVKAQQEAVEAYRKIQMDIPPVLGGKRNIAPAENSNVTAPAAQDVSAQPQTDPNEEIWLISLNIKASRAKLKALNQYMKEMEISYSLINQVPVTG